jgi:hypothetical protein
VEASWVIMHKHCNESQVWFSSSGQLRSPVSHALLLFYQPNGVPGSHVCPHIPRHYKAFLKKTLSGPGECYQPMAATRKSTHSLGHRVAAIMDDEFNITPPFCWCHTVHVPQPPLSMWTLALEAVTGCLDWNS